MYLNWTRSEFGPDEKPMTGMGHQLPAASNCCDRLVCEVYRPVEDVSAEPQPELRLLRKAVSRAASQKLSALGQKETFDQLQETLHWAGLFVLFESGSDFLTSRQSHTK